LRALLTRCLSRITLLVVMGLLIAQLGAVSHAYAHDAEAAPRTTHPAGAAGHDLCGDCLAFAVLLSLGAAPAPLPVALARGPVAAVRGLPGSHVGGSLILAFRSRAPPNPV
jgi:hypothetical protein